MYTTHNQSNISVHLTMEISNIYSAWWKRWMWVTERSCLMASSTQETVQFRATSWHDWLSSSSWVVNWVTGAILRNVSCINAWDRYTGPIYGSGRLWFCSYRSRNSQEAVSGVGLGKIHVTTLSLCHHQLLIDSISYRSSLFIHIWGVLHHKLALLLPDFQKQVFSNLLFFITYISDHARSPYRRVRYTSSGLLGHSNIGRLSLQNMTMAS